MRSLDRIMKWLPLARFMQLAWSYHDMVYAMALRDFQSRYAGTLGGTIWAVVQPLSIIAVFYFVFAIGFRVQSPVDTPFILWFVCGLMPWFLFSDTLIGVANSVTSNVHLVKKTIFPTEVLAPVKVASAIPPHAIFLLILFIMLYCFNVPFSFGRFLIVYYFICMVVVLLGLGWLLSALQVFYRDIGQALAVFLNVWFWATPIVWPEQNIPEDLRWILFYNPMYYIVAGYRDALIYPQVIWPAPTQTVFFWSFAALCTLVGSFVFNRLKPEFADVL